MTNNDDKIMSNINILIENKQKRFEETLKTWNDLKEYLDPLLPSEQKKNIQEISMYFLMQPLDDVIIYTGLLARGLSIKSCLCLKCGEELKKRTEE